MATTISISGDYNDTNLVHSSDAGYISLGESLETFNLSDVETFYYSSTQFEGNFSNISNSGNNVIGGYFQDNINLYSNVSDFDSSGVVKTTATSSARLLWNDVLLRNPEWTSDLNTSGDKTIVTALETISIYFKNGRKNLGATGSYESNDGYYMLNVPAVYNAHDNNDINKRYNVKITKIDDKMRKVEVANY